MLYIALAALGLLALTLYGSWNVMRSQNRAHARREDLLINELLHAVGKPWQPSPTDLLPSPERKSLLDEDGDLVLSQHYARFTSTPEQEP